jgi:magnesium chelatase subunit D
MRGFSTNLLKRKTGFEQKRKWSDYDQKIEKMKEMGLVKDTIVGLTLTQDGDEVKRYILNHKCELQAEIRRKIRHSSSNSSNYQTIGEVRQKPAKIEYSNRNKVSRLNHATWTGDLAVPETIMEARKNGLRRSEAGITIKKEDLMIYRKRAYMPMDVCLLIDASGSMTGEKFQASRYLAEHLLLSGKEKVAVVTFQETRGNVIVPFTRNQGELERGFRSIKPSGMTPLADGIVKSVELIESSRAHNPTLVLITDGMPNYPLWSFDPEKDALEAAQRIAESRIGLLCIGVEANRDYLQNLCDIGRGKLFVVDDLDQESLIEIVRHERRLAAIASKNR